MAFKPSGNPGLGYANLGRPSGTPDDVAQYPIGTIQRFADETQGEGEFIYLPGLAALAAGDWVVYDLLPSGPSITRLVKDTFANTGRPVAVATAALSATQYGWYQISGCAVANVVAGTVAGAVMSSATTGSASNTADAGDQILNARVSVAVGTPAANKSYVTLNRPCMQSQIT